VVAAVEGGPGRWFRAVTAAVLLPSCSIDESGVGIRPPTVPAAADAGAAEDAGFDLPLCVDSCLNDATLRSCTAGDTVCPLGCSTVSGAHCRAYVPAGGGVVAGDLQATGLGVLTIAASTTLHSDTGEIERLRTGGTGTVAGIGFKVSNGIGVFTTAGMVLAPGATLLLVGSNPVAIVSTADVTVGGVIDARGTCQGTAAGPGGGLGGERAAPGTGQGGGAAGRGVHDDASGGSGAGHAAPGGRGGSGRIQVGTPAGAVYMMPKLIGGSGGGGGGGTFSGVGGGGGGAIQLVARGKITITGGVNAGGCGGKLGVDDAGGGGGSGGTIVIEAPEVALVGPAILAVNGGGGGGGDAGRDGQSGLLAALPALGGLSDDTSGGRGGQGGASFSLAGDAGQNGLNGGGGGGGVGRILLRTTSGQAVIALNAILSPRLGDPMSAAVQTKLEVR
jgi:hypothetical protein